MKSFWLFLKSFVNPAPESRPRATTGMEIMMRASRRTRAPIGSEGFVPIADVDAAELATGSIGSIDLGLSLAAQDRWTTIARRTWRRYFGGK